MAGGLRLRLALFCVVSLSATSAGAAGVADELVREARTHELAHDDDLALRRYADALTLDPTREDAYLGLGALRFRLGDAREAERVYDAGLARIPGFAAARLGRAHVRRALGAVHEADQDLEAYTAAIADEAALRELADWYAAEGRPLAQLAVWRRLLLRASPATAALREARATVHALELIVGSSDPVRRPPGDPSAMRRGLARIAGRR